MRAVLLALLMLPLAGCLSQDDLAVEAPLLDDALILWDEGAPAANINLLGEWAQGGVAEVDAWNNLLFVDRGSSVHILDISNPTAVEEVGSFSGPHAVLDVKVTDDGQYAIVGDDSMGGSAEGAMLADTLGTNHFSSGFHVYDVRDPANPEYVSHLPVGPRRGPHMVYHANTSVGDLVLGANADITINALDKAGQLTPLSRYSPMLTDWNRDPEVFDALYQGWAHDMIIHEDQDGVLMYVANWDAGLRIVDLTDPSNPVELGKWMDFPEGHTGNLHTVDTAWIDDRRITVGSVEVGFAVVGSTPYAKGEERSVVYVWDTTDATNPVLLGWWENPDLAPAGRLEMPDEDVTSTHNLQLVDGRIYLAHYGLGVWILDVSTPEAQAEPQVLGYFLAEGQNTWDVVVHEGVTWTGGALGVMGLHFTLDEIGNPLLSGKA